MRANRSKKRQGSKKLVLGGLSVLLLGAVTFGTLVYTGVILQAKELPVASKGIPDGMVAVPIAVRDIPAYSRVTREDVINPKTGELAYVLLPKAEIPHGLKTNVEDIVGRVMERNKMAGYAFSVSEFLPWGSRSGLTGAVPPGMRMFSLETASVSGGQMLKAGDHFDLVAEMPAADFELPAEIPSNAAVVISPELKAVMKRRKQQTKVDVVIQKGKVLAAQDGAGKKPGSNLVIAVKAEDVPALVKVQSAGQRLTAIARSGQPGAESEAESATPTSQPQTQVAVLETIVGRDRKFHVFPKAR